MKKLLCLALALLFLIGCGNSNEASSEIPHELEESSAAEQSLAPTPEQPEEEIEEATNERHYLEAIVIAKNQHVAYTSDVYSTIGSGSDYYSYNITNDMEWLHWRGPRGGDHSPDEPPEAWEEKWPINIYDIPVVMESSTQLAYYGFEPDVEVSEIITERSFADNPPVYTWIRFIFTPHEVERGSYFEVSHKDFILYVDPENEYNAILAEQKLDRVTWALYTLPGYGQWLKKEINMIRRFLT